MYTLTPKSKRRPYYIRIEVNHWMDPDDPWFIDIKWIKRKDDSLVRTSTIIRSDLDDWLESFTDDEWSIETDS